MADNVNTEPITRDELGDLLKALVDKINNRQDILSDVCKGLEELRVRNKEDIRQSQIEAFRGY